MVDTATRDQTSFGEASTARSNSYTGAIDHQESSTARALEERTARIGSDRWLWAAFGSMGLSLTLKLMGRENESLFVGQWAAPFMLIGVYNKLVKIGGSDRLHA